MYNTILLLSKIKIIASASEVCVGLEISNHLAQYGCFGGRIGTSIGSLQK